MRSHQKSTSCHWDKTQLSLRALVNLRPQFGCWPIRREPPWTLTETPQTDARMGWAWSNSVTRFDRWTLRNSSKQWIYNIYIYIHIFMFWWWLWLLLLLSSNAEINPCIPACQDMFFRVAVASYSIGIIPAMEHGTKTGKNIIRDALLYIYILWVKQCHKPSPSHHHFYRCYGYHSQSWVVYYCFTHIIIWLII